MRKQLRLVHVGENAAGEETVLQASPFGTELHEIQLQPNEQVLVRTHDDSDLLVVCCRQTVETEKLIAVLERMSQLVESLMPGVKHIALQDYALLNDAPMEAKRMIAELRAN